MIPPAFRPWVRAAACATLLLAHGAADAAWEGPRTAIGPTANPVVVVADEDVFVSGADADVDQAVTGDAFAAGSRVRLRGEVKGDAVLAGGEVRVEERVGDDLYAAGGTVRVAAVVERNARLAGGKVSIGPRGAILGRATIAGGEVEIVGRIGRTLIVYADSVRLDGDVGGDLRVTARNIQIGPAAQIGGRLIYRSGAPADISSSAVIAGGLEFTRTEPFEHWFESFARAAAWVVAAILFVSLLVLGAILILALPGFSAQAARTVGSDPGKSIALGFALLFCVPAAAIVAIITVIGIPLGLALLMLYPILLTLGYLTTSMYLGDRFVALVRKQRDGTPSAGLRLAGLGVALVVLVFAVGIPYVGWLVLFVAIIAGLGALSLRCWRSYNGPSLALGA